MTSLLPRRPPPTLSPLTTYLWLLSHRAWNALMHALHGNGSPSPTQPVANIFQVSLATGSLSKTDLGPICACDEPTSDPGPYLSTCPVPDHDPGPSPDQNSNPNSCPTTPKPTHPKPRSRTQPKARPCSASLQRQVSFRLHNVCGLRDDAFRKSYLRHATCDVLACLETNCATVEEEVAWATDWAGQAFWASQYRDPTSQSLASHRGVAIFLHGSHLSTGRVIARDPDGRYLAVYVTIHSRPSLIIAVHTDCGASQAISLQRVLDAIALPPGPLDVHLMIDTNNHSSPLDYHRFAYSPDDPTLDNNPAGTAALSNLTLALGGLCDAYRSLYPDSQEFTYAHHQHGTVYSKSRIDRHYLSPSFLTGSPRLVCVSHFPPNSHALRHARGTSSHKTQCGDHAAVLTTIAYSDTPKPPPTWHLPLHLMKNPTTANQLRQTAYSSLTRHQHTDPCKRMQSMLDDVKKWARDQLDATGRAHRQLKDSVIAELSTCESMLGEGVGLAYHISQTTDPILRAAKREEYTHRRNAALSQLDNLKAKEDRRWILDHNYDTDVYDETCRREFFARQRALNLVDSHVTSLTVESDDPQKPNRTFTEQAQLNEAASRFYGAVPGGLFHLPITDDPVAENTLFSALRADGKTLPPEHSARLSSFTSIVNLSTVRAAISGMSNGSAPALDGFSTEFFALFVLRKPNCSPDDPFGDAEEDDDDAPGAEQRAQARRVIKLLVDCYEACLSQPNPSLPADWNASITSLIHKKGPRRLLVNYRPISVCPILYKILARCISDALKAALPWIVSDCQVACQEGKSCFANCRYMQDLEHYADHLNIPGLLLFADATKAFDRVNQAYLLRVLTEMHLPTAFRSLFSLLLANATTRVKVNGYIGSPITLHNGVRQGDPVAAAIFMLSLQPFLSLLSVCSRIPTPIPLANGSSRDVKLEGIPIPSAGGSPSDPTNCIAVAMADDVGLCLRDTFQLPSFKLVLAVYERASNSLNNWPKTFGYRIGSLRGSTLMPPNWNPAHVNFNTDPAIRYLGVFFGAMASIRAEWDAPTSLNDNSTPTDLTSRMSHRFSQWSSLGVGGTYAGRNLIAKNSVLAMAWYLIENQTLPDIDTVLTKWQRMSWRFVESSPSSLKLGLQAKPSHRIPRVVLVQDYAEGGRRCLDVELFTRALRVRVVRSLFEPTPHPYKNLAFYWIRRSYPSFPHHPRYLLHSNCDFSQLQPQTPQFWREALHSWGSLGNGLSPSLPPRDSSTPQPDTPEKPPPLQPTYQSSRPLAPLDDGVWHRSPTRRAGSTHIFAFAQLISMPIAHNPHLAGCLGAPPRDPISDSSTRHARDRATDVKLLRPPSQATAQASLELHRRLTLLSDRGITLIVHLLTGLTPHTLLRFKTVAELAATGRPTRRDPPIPRYLCEELLASITPNMHAVIEAATTLWSANPSLNLTSFCFLFPYPRGTWVRHTTTGYIHTTVDEDLGTETTPTTYTLSPPLAVQPDGRLARVEPTPPSVPLQQHSSIQSRYIQHVIVWRATTVAHNEEKREFESRNPKDIRTSLFLGGEAADRYYLHHDPTAPSPILDPTLLTLAYNPTDRLRPSVNLANMDVFSLYHLLLSFRHIPPRTLDPSTPASATSTSLVHLLTNNSAGLAAARIDICSASHPDPMRGHLNTHALYMTVTDARPIGNGRCQKPGPTSMHCDICWHVDRVLRRELSSHVCVDCPYSRLVVDPLMRSLLSLYAPDQPTSDHWANCTSTTLTDATECLFHTGSSAGAPFPIPPLVAANVAGCLQQALFERVARNAPRQPRPLPPPNAIPTPHTGISPPSNTNPIAPSTNRIATYPNPAISFDPHVIYDRVIALLSDRLKHSRRFASDCDDNLARLSPGIEPWLLEHGFVAAWTTEWSALTHPERPLSLPPSIDHALVGSTGVLGVYHLPLLVLPRLTILPQTGSRPAYISLRLSIGRRVGDLTDDTHTPADPQDDAWPLPAGSHPEYPVDCIEAERVSQRQGLQFRVKWRSRDAVRTWEPASSLTDTAALAAWLTRPRGIYTTVLRGSAAHLDAVLSLPNLPPARLSNLTSLRASMDPHGIIPLQPTYPNSTGGVVGGRVVFRDTKGKGNIFLTCHALIRAFVFGEYFDEVDISRSHISSALGCWALTGRTSTLTRTRMLTDQADLESDIAFELSSMRSTIRGELSEYLNTARDPPTARQSRLIAYARKALEKSHMQPKQVFSAMLNCRNPSSWRIPFPSSTCPTLDTCLNDALRMRASVLLHPLCVSLARALTAAGTEEYRAISICLGHLDTEALHAARESIHAIGIATGPTINDSLLISTQPSSERPRVLTHVMNAAATHLGFPVTFKYLPHLTKSEDPLPTLEAIATALHLSPPHHASPETSSSEASRSPSPVTDTDPEPNCYPDPSLNLGPKPSLNADTPNASCPGPRCCSLCACPLTTDDTMHMTNLFRRECPYDHMVCSTCALSAPHAFHVVGLHACVVCGDPELPPPSSPEPSAFSSQPPLPRPVHGVIYQHPPANSRSSTPWSPSSSMSSRSHLLSRAPSRGTCPPPVSSSSYSAPTSRQCSPSCSSYSYSPSPSYSHSHSRSSPSSSSCSSPSPFPPPLTLRPHVPSYRLPPSPRPSPLPPTPPGAQSLPSPDPRPLTPPLSTPHDPIPMPLPPPLLTRHRPSNPSLARPRPRPPLPTPPRPLVTRYGDWYVSSFDPANTDYVYSWRQSLSAPTPVRPRPLRTRSNPPLPLPLLPRPSASKPLAQSLPRLPHPYTSPLPSPNPQTTSTLTGGAEAPNHAPPFPSPPHPPGYPSVPPPAPSPPHPPGYPSVPPPAAPTRLGAIMGEALKGIAAPLRRILKWSGWYGWVT